MGALFLNHEIRKKIKHSAVEHDVNELERQLRWKIYPFSVRKEVRAVSR
jgi:hypothetical protein